MLTKRTFLASAAGSLALPLVARSAFAQTYPDRVVKLISSGSPGGPTDIMARLLAQRLQTALGQSIVVDSRGGGGGVVAAKAVAAADADGYTVLFCNTSVLATIPSLAKKPEYDPVADFIPVAKVSQSEQLLAVHPDVPAKSLGELLAYMKANPGKINCGATGYGGLPHLAAEYLKVQAGVDFTVVNYKGGGETLNGVLGNQIEMTLETTTVMLPYIREGRLRGLAISSETRHPQAPEIPTFAEAGVPGYTVLTFNGVVVPAKTPPAIVEKLSAAINTTLRTPEMQADVARLGGVMDIGAPQDFAKFIAREGERWRNVVEKGRIEKQ